MLRESMGGEGVQVSNTSKSFQQQQLKQESSMSMNSSGMASSSSTASSSSGGAGGGGGLSYASSMHYNSSNNNANNALSPSSTASSGSGEDTQQGNSRNSMNSNNGSMDTQQQQQQQQQHALYQNQIMNAASAMNSGAMSQVTCLVCYNAQVDVMLEPCHHQFHAHCIDRWLNKDKVCPICWNPIQSQRRILAPAGGGLYNSQQQQQQQQQQQASQPSGGAPGGPPLQSSQSLSRGGYVPNPGSNPSNNSGPVGGMTPSGGPGAAATGAPTDVPGGLAGVATMTNEPPNPATMRKGKWTAEESLYCDRLIEEFKKGNLPLAEGTTLRTFLSKLLNCDPMRISKKYTGDQCIGKIIFRRREDEVSKDDMDLIRRDLAELEKTYLEREQYNQRRREKRLESELSRDKSRYIAARTLGYNSNSGSTPTAATNAARPQMPVPVAPVGHYQQHQQNAVSAPMSAKDMNMSQVSPHHAQFPPTRGPMPIQHPSNPNIHPPRYPQHHLQHLQQQHHLQQQQQHQQQPMQSSSSHLFNSSLQSSSSSSSAGVGGLHHSSAESSSLHNGGNDSGGRSSGEGSFLSANHGSANSSSGNNSNAQASNSHQHQQQHQEHQQQSSSESFPRVSSIDSFSCLFPRVASIDNFQLPHQGQGSHNNNHHQSGGYGNNSGSFGESLSNSYDHSSGTMVKSMSIGDGLNAYFPRIQSLEQLSSLLQEHAPPSPRAKDENEHGNKQSKSMKEEGSSSSLTSGSVGGLADRKRMYDSHNSSSSSNHVKEEQQRDADADLQRRLSPNGPNKPTEHSNQIQIPKPLSKMPRSSSGIFPRIPSMDKLPRVPSLDKLPRIPSMDKLASSMDKIPRIPSMDKLSSMPRIPSHSDMLSRFGSSDHLSSFPSFSNLSSLSTCASYNNLSGLNGGGGSGFKSGFPRNSSIEDILSLVASSENSGMSSAGSHLQLSALAAVAGEESSQMAAADRKRRLEHAQEMENKKNKVST